MSSWWDNYTPEEKEAFRQKVRDGFAKKKSQPSVPTTSSPVSGIERGTRGSTPGSEIAMYSGELPLVTDAYRSFTYSTKVYAGLVAPGTYEIPKEVVDPKVFDRPVATLFGVTEEALRRARLVRLAVELGEDTTDLQYQEDSIVFERLGYLEEN